MIGRIGRDLGQLRQRDFVVPVKEGGAEPGDGAAMLDRHRPESSYMVAVFQSVFIHEPKGAGKGCREGDALLSQAFR